MTLPGTLAQHLEAVLSGKLERTITLLQVDRVHGGSVNDAFRLYTEAGSFFLKINLADQFPSLFSSEAQGLEILRKAAELRIPDVIAQGEHGDTTYLLLEYITPAEEDRDFQSRLGQRLAKLHRHSHASFGLEHDNHIGLLPQVNTPHLDWCEFLIHCRFEPLVKMAKENKRIHMGDVLRFERLYGKLPSLIPAELPALLHGDLWKNNYLAAADGEAVLIDPAVYFGHREMDIAMTRLFGGFDHYFYEAYEAEEPLQQAWEERIELCNLYPLLVHLNLFGGSYSDRVSSVLRKYV